MAIIINAPIEEEKLILVCTKNYKYKAKMKSKISFEDECKGIMKNGFYYIDNEQHTHYIPAPTIIEIIKTWKD